MIDQKEGEAELTVLIHQDEMVNCSSVAFRDQEYLSFFACRGELSQEGKSTSTRVLMALLSHLA